MKKQRKVSGRKAIDKAELNVSCRNLGRADHEGWLSKKAGGHGIIPIMWKRYWCVVKDSKLYLYKTSFDTAADYLLYVNDYSIENITEKKKLAFCMKPTSDAVKPAVFACGTEEEVKQWVELLNNILSGVDVSQKDDKNVPDYEERKRVFSSSTRESPQANRKRHSSAFQKETETTGLSTGFSSRTPSLSAPRVRYGSSGGKAETVLAVGSMFKSFEESDDTSSQKMLNDDASELLYTEVTTEVVVEPEPKQQEPTTNELNTLSLKSGTYHLQNQEMNEPKVNGDMEIIDISVTTETVPSKNTGNSEEACVAASGDSTEVIDSSLSTITVHSPNLSSSGEVFAVPISSEVSLEHSEVTPVMEVGTENTTEVAISAEVPTEDVQSDNDVASVEVSITEVTVDKHETSAVENPVETVEVKHVPLKAPVELFYTGEEINDNLPAATNDDAPIDESLTLEVTAPANDYTGDDTKEVVPELLVETTVDSTTENSVVSEVVANVQCSDVIVTSEGTVSETLTESSTVVPAVGIDDVTIGISEENKCETEVPLSEVLVESVDVSATEVADVANEMEKTQIEVSVSEAAVEVVDLITTLPDVASKEEVTPVDVVQEAAVPATEVADVANEMEKTQTEVSVSEAAVEVVAVITTVAVGSKAEVTPSAVVVQEAAVPNTEVAVANEEKITETEVAHSEAVAEELVAVPTMEVADVSNEESKIETEVVISEAQPTEDIVITSAETTGVNEDTKQAAILTECSDNVDINNKNQERKVAAEGTVSINTDVNVSVEESIESSNLDTKSDDTSMLDSVLKVSMDTSSSADESMLDAIMKVSRDTEENADNSEVEITEHSSAKLMSVDNNCVTIETSSNTIETSGAPIGTSEMVVESSQNGDVHDTTPKAEVIAKICNGDTPKAEMIVNTCNGDTPKVEMKANTTCNGDTPKAEKIANTCNGNTPTTISCQESSKPIKNSLVEYI